MDFDMFIRRRDVSGKPEWMTIQICENTRVGKKVVQKVIKNLGTARSEMERRVLEKSASLFLEESFREKNNENVLFDARDCVVGREPEARKTKTATLVNVDELQEVRKNSEGPRDIFAYAAKEERLLDVVPLKDQELLADLIAARIVEPASKKKTFENLQKIAGFDCSLDRIYRLISKLGKSEIAINKKSFGTAKKLFDDKIDLLFFDVTTLYFESWDQDDLRDFGFSKDCKFGQVQVTLALATQKDGFPVGYRLFSGNTAEISTLVSCVNDWKEHITLDNVIFVADRGMFSAKNLNTLQQAGFLFVVGCPLRKLDKLTASQILDESNYQVRSFEHNGKTELIWSGEFGYTMTYREKNSEGNFEGFAVTGRLISSYSSKRAAKDRTDREKLVEKALKKVSKKTKENSSATDLKSLLGNKGHIKFLDVCEAQTAKIVISQKKIDHDAAWDGMHGVFTNTDLTELEVLSRYRGLWQIESCFRVSKTNLKMRPIFHFTPERIRGHIALCFLSLVTLKLVEKKLKDKELSVTTDQLISEIAGIGSTTIRDKSTSIQFKVPSKLTKTAQSIYEALGLKRSSKSELI
jgi:transposase